MTSPYLCDTVLIGRINTLDMCLVSGPYTKWRWTVKTREMCEPCRVFASITGPYPALGNVRGADVVAYLYAITSRHLSPMWAARKLMAQCDPGTQLCVGWLWPESPMTGALLKKEGEGVVVLVGGGMGYDPVDACEATWTAERPAISVSGSLAGMLEYGPKQVMAWIAQCTPAAGGAGEAPTVESVGGNLNPDANGDSSPCTCTNDRPWGARKEVPDDAR